MTRSTPRLEGGLLASSGKAAFFAINPSKAFGYLNHQGVDTDTVHELNAEIRLMRELNDKRPCFVVVEGDLEYCLHHRDNLEGVNFLLFISSEEVLAQLDVPILDQGWKDGDPPVDLGAWMGL